MLYTLTMANFVGVAIREGAKFTFFENADMSNDTGSLISRPASPRFSTKGLSTSELYGS